MSVVIHIKELKAECIVGINDWERVKKQSVSINIELTVDVDEAFQSDDINDTINYRTLNKSIQNLVSKSTYFLLEKLAFEVWRLCCNSPNIKQAKVSVWKPGALRDTDNVGVTVDLKNPSYTGLKANKFKKL